MTALSTDLIDSIRADMWHWLEDFVATKNAFYAGKFAPCPYARAAINAHQVAVEVWTEGDVARFIRAQSLTLVTSPEVSTLVMAFPPRTERKWGLTEFVETLNAELIPHDIFLNTGTTKTMASRFTGSPPGTPYFIAVANRLGAVLTGSRALMRTQYYFNWPPEQLELVVKRRARMAERFGHRV